MAYDENSFLSGVAVGKSLKGWSGGSQAEKKQWAPFQVALEWTGAVELRLPQVSPRKLPYQLTEFEEVT